MIKKKTFDILRRKMEMTKKNQAIRCFCRKVNEKLKAQEKDESNKEMNTAVPVM